MLCTPLRRRPVFFPILLTRFCSRRHGWSRTFSINPTVLSTLDYSSLEQILELNTLRLRPIGMRIFIEHPPNSDQWLKVKVWKGDTSLQAALISELFESRRRDGIVTRFEVKDGSTRVREGDGLSLRTVGSRIAQSLSGGSRVQLQEEGEERPASKSWFPTFGFPFGRRQRVSDPESTPLRDDDDDDDDSHPATPAPKVSSCSYPPCSCTHILLSS